MSWLEIVGTILGVVGVALMIAQRVSAWPVGLVQVVVYGWVFYDARLYSDAILQGFFFVILGYGWWHWWRGQRAEAVTPSAPRVELPVTRQSVAALVGWGVAGIVGTAAWGTFMHRTTDAALPYPDAFILVFSLIAQWFQARKRLENWALWMMVNAVAVGVYWIKDLKLTAGLYVIFLGMAVAGHIGWRRSLAAPATA